MARLATIPVDVKVRLSFVAIWFLILFTFIAGFMCGRYVHLIDHLLLPVYPC